MIKYDSISVNRKTHIVFATFNSVKFPDTFRSTYTDLNTFVTIVNKRDKRKTFQAKCKWNFDYMKQIWINI